jgi:hypothetical protein
METAAAKEYVRHERTLLRVMGAAAQRPAIVTARGWT